MEQFKTILEKENDITNVELYMNIEGSWVIKYKYDNEEYLLNIDMLY